ncbi:hypothetical protein ACKWTF_010940 [Chironomus riparius]
MDWDKEDPEPIDEKIAFQNVEFLRTRSNNGYLTIKEGNATRIVKKDQLIWMLENNKIHVNTDLRQRFVPRRTIHITPEENQADDYWIATKVSKDDNVVLFDEGNILFGRVLNFKRMHIRSKIKSIYYQDLVDMDHSENIGVLLSPLFFIESGQKVVMNIFKFFELKCYKCHVNFNVDFTQEHIVMFFHSFYDNI